MFILRIILLLVRALFRGRSRLALENLALRQQLAILRHKAPRPHPTAVWAAQQIRETFPGDGTEPRYLLRDRDGAYGDAFRRIVRATRIREILTAPQCPWQNPYAERVIGSIRRECLDHLIILGENHLRWILREYARYCNESRSHLSLERNAPMPPSVEPSALGAVVAVPQVGGLHHRYTRAA